VSYPDFEDWRSQAASFEGMALTHGLGMTFSVEGGVAERTFLTRVTVPLIGSTPVLGRDFTPADETPGAALVVVLRYAFWDRRFAGDPAVIGRAVRADARRAEARRS
jgi:putative ABC transport system permease protein